MTHSWLPESRAGRLSMARNWISILDPPPPAAPPAWGIPAAVVTEFTALFNAAQTALEKVENDNERTRVVTALCTAAFKDLTEKMRFIKKHYFITPVPLTAADLVSLGLKSADTIKSPVSPPDAEVKGGIGLIDAHLIEVRDIRPRQDHSTDPRSDYAVDIHIGIVGGTGPYAIDAPPAPEHGGKLPFARTTRHRRERFDLEGNSGKTAWFSLAYRNQKNEVGPFCPPFSAVIP